jgi:putative transferase (TIGR04331 family)
LRTLVLRGIPPDFDSNKHILFSIANFQAHEKDYEKYKNHLSVNYTHSVTENINIGELASQYAISIIPEYAKQFNKRYQTSYPVSYWSIILYPWLVTVIQILYDRQLMVRKFISKYRDEPLEVDLLNDKISFAISDTAALQGTVQHDPLFNHWLLSRIFEEQIPSNWIANYSNEPKSNNYAYVPRKSIKQRVSVFAKRFELLLIGNVSKVYGTNVLERLFFSLLLKVKAPVESQPKKAMPDSSLVEKLQWDFNAKQIIDRLLPSAKLKLTHLDGYKKAQGKIQIYSNDLYYNMESKLKAAIHRAQKGLIIPTQHGGYKYGIGYINAVINTIEVKKDFFFSWGWTDETDERVIPLPSPMLSKLLNRHKPRTNRIILVSSIANFYGSRYNSWLPPDYIFDYRNEKRIFINTLDDRYQEALYYKPYPEKRYSLRDITYFHKEYQGLNIVHKTLKNQMLKCHLMVLDHPGTTLAMSMASNTPTVIYFKPQHFPQVGNVKLLFDEFEVLNIYHTSAESVTLFINEHYNRIPEWWSSKPVQQARLKFMDEYARANKRWFSQWVKVIWGL